MQKKTFLFILLLLSCGYLEDGLTVSFFDKDLLLVGQWIWCIIGLIIYRSQAKNHLNKSKNRNYVVIFFLIMIISTIGPYYEYNQPIEDTLISQRANYSIIVLFILLYIHPTVTDIFYAIKLAAFLSVFILIYSIINPNVFFKENVIEERLQYGSSDLGVAGLLPGFDILRIYFYFTAYKLIVNAKKSLLDIFIFLLLMTMIIVVQNRQSLIITIPIFIYTFLRIKNSYSRRAIFVMAFVSLIMLLPFLQYIYESLLNESKDQLSNTDYNRWQAIYVFLIEWKTDIFNFFFGHGIGSKGSIYTNKLSQLGEYRGAMAQDIGFLGSYFFYGILFVLLNYYFIVQGFFRKKMPLYLKFWCFGFLLIPVYQYWGMMNNGFAVVFSILIYLVMYNKQYNTKNNIDGKVSIKNATSKKLLVNS